MTKNEIKIKKKHVDGSKIYIAQIMGDQNCVLVEGYGSSPEAAIRDAKEVWKSIVSTHGK